MRLAGNVKPSRVAQLAGVVCGAALVQAAVLWIVRLG